MKEIKSLLNKMQLSETSDFSAVEKNVKEGDKFTGSRQQEERASRDHVDAINQMFAEFELAYHNQYHKAYSGEGSVGVAKKYWLSCLARFSPELILRSARTVVSSQEYLPSVASIIKCCEQGMTLFGMPAPHDAYIEACCATSPKIEYRWSHPAVYLAGKATDWFALANSPESNIYSLFEYHYKVLCGRVINGEHLEIKIPKALPESIAVELSVEENKAHLRELRNSLKL
jgi:hypothetical protein